MRPYRFENALISRPNFTAIFIRVFILVAVLAAITYFFILPDDSENALELATRVTQTETNRIAKTAEQSHYLLTIEDQSAGRFVKIAALSVPADTWLAIYEDKEGTPGNILGAARFREGSPFNTVELLREMIAGNLYYAIFHIDDGDIEFNFKKDVPLVTSDGQNITTTFRAVSNK